MQAENSITGISQEDNVPMHLQHLQVGYCRIVTNANTLENKTFPERSQLNVYVVFRYRFKLLLLQELKPLKKSGRSRPATAVEERLHRSVKQEIAALEREIQAEVEKRNKLEKKLKKTIAVSKCLTVL